MVLRRTGCCVVSILSCSTFGGTQEVSLDSIEDTVVLLQKASTAAEGRQFPMWNPMVMNPMVNPMAMASMMNPWAMMNPMVALAAKPMMSQAANTMRARPKVPGFSVVVDNPAGASFKLNQKMDQMGISPSEFYANTVVIDKFGMRVSSDKAPRFDQYPLIYKYSEPTGGSSMQASGPAVRPAMPQGISPALGMGMAMMGGGMMPQPQYDGLWHRVVDADDRFEIHGNLMRWSKQPANSPPMQVSTDTAGQLTIMKQGIVQSGRLDGFRLLWSDGDIWVRDSKVKTSAEKVVDNFMAAVGGNTARPMLGNRRERDLAFVHVPSNFASEIEEAVTTLPKQSEVDAYGYPLEASSKRPAGGDAGGVDNQLWGEKNPALRETSAATGCSVFASPSKYWPEEIAGQYFAYDEKQNRTVVGVLRDPYDKLVNEFRVRAEGGVLHTAKYKKWFDDCDVSSWAKEVLRQVKENAFVDNCHFLPQSEYFDGPNGINLPVDGRLMPLSFYEVMERHGYSRITMNSTFAHSKCDVSAWSLDDEAKSLVKDVYASDFKLLCKHFGYCDASDLTCLNHIPGMCGGAPKEPEEETEPEPQDLTAQAWEPEAPTWELGAQ